MEAKHKGGSYFLMIGLNHKGKSECPETEHSKRSSTHHPIDNAKTSEATKILVNSANTS